MIAHGTTDLGRPVQPFGPASWADLPHAAVGNMSPQTVMFSRMSVMNHECGWLTTNTSFPLSVGGRDSITLA